MARVLVDTNVLFPFSIMDVMLALTEDHIHEIVLTETLVAEWQRVITREQRRSEQAASAIAEAIREFFADSFLPVEAYQDLIGQMPGPDEDDRHHMAAAVAAGASIIVTWNRSDFPSQPLARHGIRVLTPDEYLCELVAELPREVTDTVVRIAAEKKRPTMTPAGVANRLSAAGVPNFSIRLKDRLDLGSTVSASAKGRVVAQRRVPGAAKISPQDVASYLARHRPPAHCSVKVAIPPHEPVGEASHMVVINVALMEMLSAWPDATILVIDYRKGRYAQAQAYPPSILTEIGTLDAAEMLDAIAFGWMDPSAVRGRHDDFESQPAWDQNPVREWIHPFDSPAEVAAFLAASVRAVLRCEPAEGYTLELFNNNLIKARQAAAKKR